MKVTRYEVELITPCFCAGANQAQAELRAPSIRGQLRWWFRVLGGFKVPAQTSLREQEAHIFGSASGDGGVASKLIIRVSGDKLRSNVSMTAEQLDALMQTAAGYLLFPLRINPRACLPEGTKFNLHVLWRGAEELWPSIEALLAVYGALGSLGFRSRRAMGALFLHEPHMKLADALNHFSGQSNLSIRRLNESLASAGDCRDALARWLKAWRQHGRKPHLAISEPGFDWARRDHNEGFRVLTNTRVTSNPTGHVPKGNDGDTFRSALGLPIVQFFSSQPRDRPSKVTWMPEFDQQKAEQDREYKGEGRFASPILLRPHRTAEGDWHALVIFVESRKWPENKPVYLNGNKRRVSLGLYEEMKKDTKLVSFP